MHKKNIREIIEKGDPKAMEELECLMVEAIDHIKECDKELYKKMEMKLYVALYGKVLNEDMAHEIVYNMKPYGEHWDIEETTNLLRTKGWNIRPIDFYVVINAMYNDDKRTVDKFIPEENHIDFYADISRDFIQDEDAKEGKVFRYFTKIPK